MIITTATHSIKPQHQSLLVHHTQHYSTSLHMQPLHCHHIGQCVLHTIPCLQLYPWQLHGHHTLSLREYWIYHNKSTSQMGGKNWRTSEEIAQLVRECKGKQLLGRRSVIFNKLPPVSVQFIYLCRDHGRRRQWRNWKERQRRCRDHKEATKKRRGSTPSQEILTGPSGDIFKKYQPQFRQDYINATLSLSAHGLNSNISFSSCSTVISLLQNCQSPDQPWFVMNPLHLSRPKWRSWGEKWKRGRRNSKGK